MRFKCLSVRINVCIQLNSRLVVFISSPSPLNCQAVTGVTRHTHTVNTHADPFHVNHLWAIRFLAFSHPSTLHTHTHTHTAHTHYNFSLNYILPANYLVLFRVSLQMYHLRFNLIQHSINATLFFLSLPHMRMVALLGRTLLFCFYLFSSTLSLCGHFFLCA